MKRSLAIVFSTLLALGAASTAFADGTTQQVALSVADVAGNVQITQVS